MTKTGHQQPPAPVDPADAVTQEHGDANYSGGGSGPLAAAQGAYLSKTLGTDQIDVVTNDTIAFDTVVEQQGDISSSGNQFADLKAGRTYFLLAQGRRTDGTYVTMRWYDDTGSVFIGAASVYGTNFQNTDVHAIFTPLVDSTVELRAEDASGSPNIQAVTSLATVMEIGAVQADVVGGLEFMDIIEVGAPTDSVSFGATGDGAFQRALDGDVDQEYVMDFRFNCLATSDFSFRPNGITANQEGRRYTGGSSVSGELAYLVVSQQETGDTQQGSLHFSAARTRGGVAQPRPYHSEATWYDSSGSTPYPRGAAGSWNDIATLVDSIDMASETGSNIDTGSYFILWRKTRTNLRADSAAVYERNAIEVVDPGAIATTERTTGHSTYGGSVVGISVRVEDAVTAGTITCNVKVDGVTALTAVLDTTNSTSRVVRAAVGMHKFAADKNISVEFVPSAYDNAGSVPSSVTVQVHLTNDALITQNDRIVARHELTANSDNLSLLELNGDLDGEYEVVGRLKMNTTSAHTVSWLPNALTTDMSIRSYNDGTPTDSSVGVFLSAGGVTNAVEFEFRARFWAGRGVTRRGFESIGSALYNLSTIFVFQSSGFLLNDTDNITSLVLFNSVASGFLAGSWAEVRRIKA